jgi:hypothetical protein
MRFSYRVIFAFLFLFWILPQLLTGVGHVLPLLFAIGLIAAGVRMLINRAVPSVVKRGTFINERQDVTHRRKKQDSSQQSRAVSRARDNAGNSNYDLDIELLDIGLLVYEDDNHPKIFRLGEVPDHSRHIRPFIVLQALNVTNTDHKVIRFNLLDGAGQLRYTSRSRYRLKSQANFVTPSTWLPIKDVVPSGDWTLQINIGEGSPLAIHEFRWFEVGGALRAQFDGDGELDEPTRDLMLRSSKGLALEDLLAVQEEEIPVKVGAGRLS